MNGEDWIRLADSSRREDRQRCRRRQHSAKPLITQSSTKISWRIKDVILMFHVIYYLWAQAHHIPWTPQQSVWNYGKATYIISIRLDRIHISVYAHSCAEGKVSRKVGGNSILFLSFTSYFQWQSKVGMCETRKNYMNGDGLFKKEKRSKSFAKKYLW